jgi:tetratricopeptide (TPR) repeat protein
LKGPCTYSLFIIFIGFSCYTASSQQRKTDSLQELIKKEADDTTKVNHLNELGSEWMNINPDSAITPLTKALAIATQIKWLNGQSISCSNLGSCHYLKGNYPLALEFYLQAIKNYETLGNTTGLARNLSKLGNVYFMQSDFQKALDYYSKALIISEEHYEQAQRSGDSAFAKISKNIIATQVGNIGNVYNMLGATNKDSTAAMSLFGKALEYYFRTLKIEQDNLEHTKRSGRKEDLKENLNGIAIWLANIGTVYNCQALLAKEQKTQERLFSKALTYYSQARDQYESVENKSGLADQLGNMGLIYLQTKKYSAAENHLLHALKLVREIGALNDERRIEEHLTGLYEKTERHTLALEHYKHAMALKDSIFSQEKNNEITRKEMNYEFEKKQAADKADHDKQMAVAQAGKKRQRLFLWLSVAGLFFTVAVALIILRSLRLTRKQQLIIETQKKLVENQKALVEEKQKAILDSIHYAKRIQRSLLPSEKYIRRIVTSKE